MTDHTIILTDADAGELKVEHEDKIVWENASGFGITLHPPACVSPNRSEDIPDGACSIEYFVNTRTCGDYDYSFNVKNGTAGIRSGTIDVSE